MYDAIKETSGQSDIDKSTVLFRCEMIDILLVGYGYIYVGPETLWLTSALTHSMDHECALWTGKNRRDNAGKYASFL